MSVRNAIERARAHLAGLGIAAGVEFGPALTESKLRELLDAGGDPRCPESVLAVYHELGDGFCFRWSEDQSPDAPMDDEAHKADLTFPPLSVLIQRRLESSTVWWVTQDFSGFNVDDVELANRTGRGMANWSWFYEEPNGDELCVDFATGQIVYHQHDWFDCGTGGNGDLMGADLPAFLTRWATVCFTCPGGRYWPEALTPEGVAWTPEFFTAKYILSSAR
jgi:hypothetical protein